MRVAVIGAGIVGVSTAYELASDGHEVVVFERRSSVAEESSFACGGIVAPGWFDPWTAPPRITDLLARVADPHSSNFDPASVRDWRAAGWLWRSRRSGRGPHLDAHRRRLYRLAKYSRRRLLAVSQREGLSFDQQSGCLVLLRDRQELAAARGHLRALTELGVEFKLIDPVGARAVEPGLSSEAPLHAAVYLRQALSGNGRLLAQGLRAAAVRSGARFCFSRQVVELSAGHQPEIRHRAAAPDRLDLAASGDSGPSPSPNADPSDNGVSERFDAIVVCAAMGAPALLSGLRLPMMPVHGCSITVPLRAGAESGVSTTALVDQRHQVSIARHAGRLRVSGGTGWFGSASGQPAAVETRLYRVLDDWLTGPVERVKAQRWNGSRPSLPDGLPIVGACGAAGIWLNLGHGGGGMALASGSARVVADLVNRRRPDIDIEGLDAGRLG